MADVFTALSDSMGRIILDELTDRDGQTLFEICMRLVETRREDRYKFHHLNTEPLEPIIDRWLIWPGPAEEQEQP